MGLSQVFCAHTHNTGSLEEQRTIKDLEGKVLEKQLLIDVHRKQADSLQVTQGLRFGV
jgi:hypothetical protein